MKNECENDKEPLITHNSDVIVFDFPEFDQTTNTPSSSKTLRPRVLNSNNLSDTSISGHVTPDNTRTPEHIDNNTIELAVNITPDLVDGNGVKKMKLPQLYQIFKKV